MSSFLFFVRLLLRQRAELDPGETPFALHVYPHMAGSNGERDLFTLVGSPVPLDAPYDGSTVVDADIEVARVEREVLEMDVTTDPRVLVEHESFGPDRQEVVCDESTQRRCVRVELGLIEFTLELGDHVFHLVSSVERVVQSRRSRTR